MREPSDGLYIVFISVHGFIRGHDLELGRDADTGGQTKYVVELARALGEHPDARRVDLITRQVFDNKVDSEYHQPCEARSEFSNIIRLPCEPRRYFRKEVLWPYLDRFIDNIQQQIRRVWCIPDLVHSYYADAGYVGSGLVQLLGIPFIFTGHTSTNQEVNEQYCLYDNYQPRRMKVTTVRNRKCSEDSTIYSSHKLAVRQVPAKEYGTTDLLKI